MELLIIIGILALVVLGYFQAKKQDTVLLDAGLKPTEFLGNEYLKLEYPNRPAPMYFNSNLTPKQYGEQYGNGKSRIKKSNRLHFRK